nr:hypothetical protein [Vibrio nigripulchritudo]
MITDNGKVDIGVPREVSFAP